MADRTHVEATYVSIRRCLLLAEHLLYLIRESAENQGPRRPEETDFGYNERREIHGRMAEEAMPKLALAIHEADSAFSNVEADLATAFHHPCPVAGRNYSSYHRGALETAKTVIDLIEMSLAAGKAKGQTEFLAKWDAASQSLNRPNQLPQLAVDEVDAMLQKEAILALKSWGNSKAESLPKPLDLTLEQIARLTCCSTSVLEKRHRNPNRPQPIGRGRYGGFLYSFQDARKWIELDHPGHMGFFPTDEQTAMRRLTGDN
jgi:hypothetical protein